MPEAIEVVNDVRPKSPKSYVEKVLADRGQKQINTFEQLLCKIAIEFGAEHDIVGLVDFTLGYVGRNSKTLDVESICLNEKMLIWNASRSDEKEKEARVNTIINLLDAEQKRVGPVR